MPGSDCPEGGGGMPPVSDHAHIVAKWQFCEKKIEMCNLHCKLNLKESRFEMYYKRGVSNVQPGYQEKMIGKKLHWKSDENKEWTEINLAHMFTVDTIKELEAFLMGYDNGRPGG